MSQETRNKVYAVVTGLLGIALILGIVHQAQADVIIDVTNRLLELAPTVIGLVSSALAWAKSRPSKVAVVEVPLASVKDIVNPGGTVLAGPGSRDLADGVATGQYVVGDRRAA